MGVAKFIQLSSLPYQQIHLLLIFHLSVCGCGMCEGSLWVGGCVFSLGGGCGGVWGCGGRLYGCFVVFAYMFALYSHTFSFLSMRCLLICTTDTLERGEPI